jgi:hypothetical protein
VRYKEVQRSIFSISKARQCIKKQPSVSVGYSGHCPVRRIQIIMQEQFRIILAVVYKSRHNIDK